MMKIWEKLPTDHVVEKTAKNLRANGINVFVTEDKLQARAKVLEILPRGALVMNMTSITLEELDLVSEINDSGKFDSVKNKLGGMNRAKDGRQMQMLGSAPDWAVGSVHAITEDGQVLIASNTGSQLGAYAYGAQHVLWIVGTQKIVKDFNKGMRRIQEYTVPLETKRARKAYGLQDSFSSFVSKLLIVNKEVKPGRIVLIFVKEILGF